MIKNLPYNITPDEMYEIFGKFGSIRQIRVFVVYFKVKLLAWSLKLNLFLFSLFKNPKFKQIFIINKFMAQQFNKFMKFFIINKFMTHHLNYFFQRCWKRSKRNCICHLWWCFMCQKSSWGSARLQCCWKVHCSLILPTKENDAKATKRKGNCWIEEMEWRIGQKNWKKMKKKHKHTWDIFFSSKNVQRIHILLYIYQFISSNLYKTRIFIQIWNVFQQW